VATIAPYGSWQGTLRMEGFRFEIVPPEVAINYCPPELIMENCMFAAGSIPTYPVIQSGYGCAIIRGCQFGGPGDQGWLTFGGIGSGVQGPGPVSLEMVNNVVYGTVPFVASSFYEMKYSLFGNQIWGALGDVNGALYGGANGSSAGRTVGGNMVNDVDHGSATFQSAGSVQVTFSSPREDNTYTVTISGNANETFWVTKSANGTGFVLQSSNPTSVATVDWTASRLAPAGVAPA
jgi:hypothetical protein